MKRNVIVICSNTQSRHNFNDVEVNTLADVKALLDEKGISYVDQAFYEGVSKAEYDSDDSVMPSNLPFKGKVTNDLVFMLSNKSKKIASGVYTRQECYQFIKDNKLAKAIMEEYGLMYTSVSTERLNDFIAEYKRSDLYYFDDKPEKVDESKFITDIIGVLTKYGYIVSRRCEPDPFTEDEIDEMFKDRL